MKCGFPVPNLLFHVGPGHLTNTALLGTKIIQETKCTNVLLGLSSLTTGVVLSFQSSMMFTENNKSMIIITSRLERIFFWLLLKTILIT